VHASHKIICSAIRSASCLARCATGAVEGRRGLTAIADQAGAALVGGVLERSRLFLVNRPGFAAEAYDLISADGGPGMAQGRYRPL
jgi:hypothetical protein